MNTRGLIKKSCPPSYLARKRRERMRGGLRAIKGCVAYFQSLSAYSQWKIITTQRGKSGTGNMNCYSPFNNNRGITGKLLTFNQYTYHSFVLENHSQIRKYCQKSIRLGCVVNFFLSFFDFYFNLLIFKFKLI